MRRSLAALAAIGILATIFPDNAEAQVPPPAIPITVPTTPEDIIAYFETGAKRLQDRGGSPALRLWDYVFKLPDSATEFAATGRYGLLLVSVLTQKPEELPLRRVYIRSNGPDLPLQNLLSWRSEYDSKLLAYTVYGRYREDGFYLLPMGPMTRDGMLVVEYGTSGVYDNLLKLPEPIVVQRGFATSDPSSDVKPDPKALRALMERKFRGFPMPNF